MSAKFKGERQWTREILRKFGELQDFQPKPFCDEPKWPEWVSNLVVVFFGIAYPGVKIKNVKRWKAKDLGRFLGRQYAGEQLMMGGVRLSSKVMEEGQRFAVWAEKWAEQKCPDIDLNKIQKQYEQEARVWRPQFRKFMQETLSSACERPYIECSAFFEAFGKAIVIKPDELLTERRMGVGDKIAWTMFVLWQEIERLHSVGELHRILQQGLKSTGIIVEHKRIEKLCQRIKLKFKEPGRPPGSKTQTNPTLV